MQTDKDVLDFWFGELTPADWFSGDEVLDDLIEQRFLSLHNKAVLGELYTWRKSPQGRLAEIIVLDQFSRNLYRGKPHSFLSDPMALVLAQEAVALGEDMKLSEEQRSFLYMPYMHSESLVVHEEAVRLFKQSGLENNLDFEYRHKVIIERFGRYPHRNKILGRQSSEEELEFLTQPGSSF
ncbi:DUF924 domain-containing protein [Vibrio mediterranei]|uniref:DUF924 family protein n=1 Tax=Vibrio mediterranei TaxID=689 RepID=UPI000D187173|nr:DUF924 family protein [Vibrio mediterranei]PTC05759.1 DUF924 domain-containing protein [Vibrio mediterranei]